MNKTFSRDRLYKNALQTKCKIIRPLHNRNWFEQHVLCSMPSIIWNELDEKFLSVLNGITLWHVLLLYLGRMGIMTYPITSYSTVCFKTSSGLH